MFRRKVQEAMSSRGSQIGSAEQLLQLLRRGASEWNQWRKKHPNIRIDLSRQEIAAFGNIDTFAHHLAGPRQKPSVFQVFRTLHLEGVDLSECDLSHSIFREVDLEGANFRGANLCGARFIMTRLDAVDFSAADLRGADLHLCSATHSKWQAATIGDTRFGFCSLRQAVDLDSVDIESPSHIDSFTIAETPGIPRSLLLRCRLPAELHRLAGALSESPGYRTSFLSFSSKNEDFVRRVRRRLLAVGAPCWYAHQDMRQPTQWLDERLIEKSLYRSIDSAEGIVIFLSQASSESSWVEKEVERSLNQWSRLSPAYFIITWLLEEPRPPNRPWVAKLRQFPRLDLRGSEKPDAIESGVTRLVEFLRREGH